MKQICSGKDYNRTNSYESNEQSKGSKPESLGSKILFWILLIIVILPENLGSKIGFWITLVIAILIAPWIYLPTVMYSLGKYLDLW